MEKHHLHHQKKQNIIQIGNTENLPYFGHKKQQKKKHSYSYSHHPYCCCVYIPSTNPFAHPSHPSCLYYYLLSPIYCFCTSCFCTSYLFLHILFCTFLYSITLFTLYFSFLPIYMLLCGVTFYIIFYSLHCPLSGPDSIYISLLIIPCIIYHVTNKETLNLEPWIKILW